MQFDAQHKHYQTHFGDASFDLILVDGKPSGRLYLHRRDNEHRVVDIALLPEHRKKGIGRKLMQDILDEAGAANLPVQIHVERNNPALRLYQHLGFKKIEDLEVYWLMRWEPSEAVNR